MTFYIYENWTVDRSRVHRAECSYCNNGNGIHVSNSGRNGKWHGPFSELKLADEAARKLNRADNQHCNTCRP
jgi:hypothetical protein